MTEELDPLIHATSRLRIMTTLASIDDGASLSFAKLSDLLGMTAGNLSVHLTKLEQAGYVTIEKTFEGRKPATYAAITPAGRKAFDGYLAALKALLAPVQGAEADF
ncbi:winged helix-turn-helix domain-containing protein [Bifidobacterium avesanii]|uniref:ArsR family transcriptional regulator n=1 Tax=Bifidobacterium avesanii TaxID=1798157 RepID=A0A7K3THM4_9BIFI|nr:transcriptional regulator [Bifidobacterium avesanii]KAB8287735.1 MarR family transcriptional regulator [Bifidobacterium avesanii]NEG78194.1 ArsR family transcriptional regulator [Bifidobacterium avesanii]